MNRLGLKRGINYCFPIHESSKKALIDKVCAVNKETKCMLELRIDYLLCTGLNIEEIIDIIALIKKKYTHKKLIATIRTIDEGGKVDLPKEKYFYFIKMLYLKSKVHAIDVEYKYYNIDKKYYDSLFKKKKKDVIISMHIFDRVFFQNEYADMFKAMAESTANIVKFAVKTYTKDDLFDFMHVARKSFRMLKRNKKKAIFIAMGELGKVSRVFPEYTHTSIVFVSAYGVEDKDIGIISRPRYLKYRKLLAKKLKN